jgi:hypothetical protein
MYDEFIQLVKYKEWSLAFEFLSTQTIHFKEHLSSASKKDQEKMIKALKTLYKNLENDFVKEIFRYEFANTIQLYDSGTNFVEMFFQNSESKECLICMETIQFNESIIFCKTCSTDIGHLNCCKTWFNVSEKCPGCYAQ